MMPEPKKIDWNRLCNAPGIIFVQRWLIAVSAPIAVAAFIGAFLMFKDMRDATRDLTGASARIELKLDDHEGRLRRLERQGAATPGRW